MQCCYGSLVQKVEVFIAGRVVESFRVRRGGGFSRRIMMVEQSSHDLGSSSGAWDRLGKRSARRRSG